jgi:succinoglycan biosynthesis transport protein ExoP
LYETLHSRLTELELEGKAPARISIEAHATEPSRPSGDRRIVFTVLAFGSAMFLAFGVGYVRYVLDPRVREALEVRESVRAPFLGQLPPLPTTARVFEGTTPFLLESIRMVRTALLQRLGDAPGSIILVTSTTSRSGKSTVTALLGQSLSALGRRTLIVEADLRRPSLGERLGLSDREGLGALLCGTASGSSVVRPSGHARLDVALAGELPDDFDSEFLANGRFREALADWRKTYDFVLVDSPPVLPVADSRILAGMTDGVLLILRSTHTRRADVVQSIQDIHSSGGQLIGTVLVGTRFGSGYGYDAGYYSYAGRRPKALAVSGEVRV